VEVCSEQPSPDAARADHENPLQKFLALACSIVLAASLRAIVEVGATDMTMVASLVAVLGGSSSAGKLQLLLANRMG